MCVSKTQKLTEKIWNLIISCAIIPSLVFKGRNVMKILVLSDSHSSLQSMRSFINVLKPDCMIHLGDYYDDAQCMEEEYPQIPMIHVPGNCDSYRAPIRAQKILKPKLEGVTFFLTHGHLHHVKMNEYELIHDARKEKAQVVLYGHTHIPALHQEEDGMWVMNPGTCGYMGGSAGLIEVEDGLVKEIRILYSDNLEEFK